MTNQEVYYLRHKTQKTKTGGVRTLIVGGHPWATPFRELAEFMAWAKAEQGHPWWAVERFRSSVSFPLMSQRDSRWKDIKLGYGNTTIGAYGCLITCIAMAASAAQGQEVTPEDVNRELKKWEGFSGDNQNELVWSAVPKAFPVLRFVGRKHYSTTPAPVQQIAADINKGNLYFIVRVDHILSTTVVDEHWILLTGGDESGFTYHDPWLLPADQQEGSMPPGFSKAGWTPARAVFSVAIFGRNA
jgi:hypothetical protein